jgi:hypothetical protein
MTAMGDAPYRKLTPPLADTRRAPAPEAEETAR